MQENIKSNKSHLKSLKKSSKIVLEMIKKIVAVGSNDEELKENVNESSNPKDALMKYKEIIEVSDDFIERSNYLIDNLGSEAAKGKF
jgi:hypothetical protein